MSFGKVKFRKSSSTNKKLDKLFKAKQTCSDADEKLQLDKEIESELEAKRKQNMNKRLEYLRNLKKKKGTAAAVFNLKEAVVGKKKVEQEATVLFDPETKSEVNCVEGIKRVSLNYCKKLLTNRVPNPGYEHIIEMKSKLHEARMMDFNPDAELEMKQKYF